MWSRLETRCAWKGYNYVAALALILLRRSSSARSLAILQINFWHRLISIELVALRLSLSVRDVRTGVPAAIPSPGVADSDVV